MLFYFNLQSITTITLHKSSALKEFLKNPFLSNKNASKDIDSGCILTGYRINRAPSSYRINRALFLQGIHTAVLMRFYGRKA